MGQLNEQTQALHDAIRRKDGVGAINSFLNQPDVDPFALPGGEGNLNKNALHLAIAEAQYDTAIAIARKAKISTPKSETHPLDIYNGQGLTALFLLSQKITTQYDEKQLELLAALLDGGANEYRLNALNGAMSLPALLTEAAPGTYPEAVKQEILDPKKRLTRAVLNKNLASVNAVLAERKNKIHQVKDGYENLFTQDSVTGNSIYHLAAETGDAEVLKALITTNKESKWQGLLNEKNNEGLAPLHIAAINGHAKAVRVLLDHKANPELANGDGSTYLQLTTQGGHYNIFHAVTPKPWITLGRQIAFIAKSDADTLEVATQMAPPLANSSFNDAILSLLKCPMGVFINGQFTLDADADLQQPLLLFLNKNNSDVLSACWQKLGGPEKVALLAWGQDVDPSFMIRSSYAAAPSATLAPEATLKQNTGSSWKWQLAACMAGLALLSATAAVIVIQQDSGIGTDVDWEKLWNVFTHADNSKIVTASAAGGAGLACVAWGAKEIHTEVSSATSHNYKPMQ